MSHAIDLQLFDDSPTQDLQIAPDDDLGVNEKTTMPAITPDVVDVAPLAQLLPADFPLPMLIRFVPSTAIKSELETAVAYASALDITDKGIEGLQAADMALDALNAVIKKTTQHFAEPADIANRLHKSITSVRAAWCDPAEAAKRALGGKLYAEKTRLEAIAAAERRKQQDEADARAREDARRAAEEAARNKAPEAVVEKLKEQAKTAVAPPVPVAPAPVAAMKSSTTVTTWKARIKGTPADADPNPDMDALTPMQWVEVARLLTDIADGKAPRAAVAIDWSYLNSRAKSDKSTLQITGIEAFAEGSVRAKGRR